MKILNLICAIISMGLMACSADIKSSNGDQPKKDQPAALAIQGSYQSDCVKAPLGGMKVVTLVGKDSNITVTTANFRGDTCEDEISSKDLKGSFEELSSSANGKLIRFKIPVNDVAYTWRFLNVEENEDGLSISEYFSDEDQAKDYPLTIQLNEVSE